ncbi:MAG: DUF3990 domain-containing protein [Lachnospiraceae bacterium]
MRLYHGSKSGIKGEIRPDAGRGMCDFGAGFYMGDRPEQPMGLIAGWKNHRFYDIEFTEGSLKIRRFGNTYEEQLDWALFIAYNRNPAEFVNKKRLCERYERYHSVYDVIVGLIANDKMFQLLERFYDGTLCDKALIDGLSRVKLGYQYVLKTKEACLAEHIRIISDRQLTDKERKMALVQNDNKLNQMSGFIGELQRRYRRAENVRFFDEIMEELG